ncbi:MAG: hypothetical protein A2289_09930 [Deltaproteobacteria bacterium RIFOXYA12_FULL_58_15]|nr:MAG: hypothetical protein A2289_09930 [Deltaproteobacteria bacterium RIFOXYA12_FULL_58_15]OGR07329.1 MAG: hypothetical protein A2341_03145 [Deltaproteobacteria bacterium RIFOXYB12_FULL_58_9]
MAVLNPDFRDMLSALSEAQVDFLVVGAYALAAHGVPRATGDIDIWIRPTPKNAQRVIRALTVFGAPLDQITEQDLATTNTVFQIGLPPRRIDLLTSITGIEFEGAWANRKMVEVEGISLPILAKGDFLANKRALGRTKDLADIEALADLPSE